MNVNKKILSVSIEEIIKEVNLNLEDIAKSIVAKEIEQEDNDLIKQYKQQFFVEIDSNKQHKFNWHQWGIITHSRNCMTMYDNEVKQYLKAWSKFEITEKYLLEKIDGITKSKLIYLGILLHDIGKFKKQYSIESNGKVKYSFNKHELYSQEIIQNDLYPMLKDYYGLTNMQIEYISMCSRYHGFIRKISKKSKYGHSVEFAQSETFKDTVLNELSSLEEYKVELGILFLVDSCAKTDIAFENKTDKELLKDLELRNLNPKLINAVKQKSSSIEIAKSYFNTINGE